MAKKAKTGAGRPEHVPTEAERSIVKIFVAAGLSNVEIARYMKMDRKTLTKHYGDELEIGWVEAVGDAAKAIIEEMRNEDSDKRLDAAKFFLSRRGRGMWSEQKNVEVGVTKNIPVAVDIDALDYEELVALDNMLSPLLIEGEVIDVDEADADGAD